MSFYEIPEEEIGEMERFAKDMKWEKKLEQLDREKSRR